MIELSTRIVLSLALQVGKYDLTGLNSDALLR